MNTYRWYDPPLMAVALAAHMAQRAHRMLPAFAVRRQQFLQKRWHHLRKGEGLMIYWPTPKLNFLNELAKPRALRFVLASSLTVVVGVGGLWLFTEVGGLYYLASNVLAFMLSTAAWFKLNSWWTFSDKQKVGFAKGYFKSIGLRLVVLGLNTGLLAGFTELLGLWYIISAILAIVLVWPFSFTVATRWIWKEES